MNTDKILAAMDANRGRYEARTARRTLGNGTTQIFAGDVCVEARGGYVSITGARADTARKWLLAARAIAPLPRTNTTRIVYVAL